MLLSRKGVKLSFSDDSVHNIANIRGAVIWAILVSILMIAAGIFLIAAYYFDLLYLLAENRIIEYADPLVGPTTMPIVVIMTIGSLLSIICSITLLILMCKADRYLKPKAILTLLIGIGNLLNFLFGLFLGVYIISYLFSQNHQPDRLETDEIDSEKAPEEKKQLISLLMINSMYRLTVGVTLFAVYHVMFVIPYEHMGVENAPIIRTIWTLLLVVDSYWIIMGLLAMGLSIGLTRNRPLKTKEVSRNPTKMQNAMFWLYIVLNIPCIPAGSLLAMELIRLKRNRKNL